MNRGLCFILVCCAFFAFQLKAEAGDWQSFSSSLHETRYQHLIEELRCPKCLNQNLADSTSGIAVDLRHQVYQMIEGDKTDQEIIDYMVARYGEFVLYRPVNNLTTYALWYGPFILLLIGGVAFFLVIKRSRSRQGRRDS
ncbi:cytochrome c-type biogenesis protein [Marinomonas sp.]